MASAPRVTPALTALVQDGTLVNAGNPLVVSAVITPSGTTVVTGTVTAVQATGTNLHTVVDSGTLDAVLQVGTANVGNTNPVPVIPSTNTVVSGSTSTTGTADVAITGTVAAKSIFCEGLSVANSGTTAAIVSFKDGSGGAVLWVVSAPAGGGATMNGSILFKTTAGNAIYAAASAASTTVYISASGISG